MTPHHSHRLAVAGVLAASLALTSAPGASAAATAHAAAASTHQSKKAAAKKRAAKRRRSRAVARPAKPLSSISVADALAKVPAYTGPTGAVVHAVGVSVNFPSTDPLESRGGSLTIERWSEIGGGQRMHELVEATDEDDQQIRSTEWWRTPLTWAVIAGGAPPSIAIFCSPLPEVAPDPLIREDIERLASLPAGPAIGGLETKVGVHPMPIAGAGGAPEFRNYLDAATGRPLRTTYRPYDRDTISFQTDYRVWELIPAGGSADALAGVLPAETELADDRRGQPGCIG